MRAGRLRTTCDLQGQSTYTSALVYAALQTEAYPIESTGTRSCPFVASFDSVAYVTRRHSLFASTPFVSLGCHTVMRSWYCDQGVPLLRRQFYGCCTHTRETKGPVRSRPPLSSWCPLQPRRGHDKLVYLTPCTDPSFIDANCRKKPKRTLYTGLHASRQNQPLAQAPIPTRRKFPSDIHDEYRLFQCK